MTKLTLFYFLIGLKCLIKLQTVFKLQSKDKTVLWNCELLFFYICKLMEEGKLVILYLYV